MRPGDAIRDYRRAHNLSQEELAAKTGVNGPAISRYESGQRPTVAAAKRATGEYYATNEQQEGWEL